MLMQPLLLDPFDAFVGELEKLDQDLIALRVEVARVVLHRPSVGDYEASGFRLPAFIKDADGDVLAALADKADRDVVVPLEQLERIGARREAALQRDIAVFREPRKLS